MRAFCSTSRIAVPAACTSRITRKISCTTIGASPGEGQHLLLAAGERPRHLAAAFAQYGKQVPHALQITAHFAVAPSVRAQGQVFLDRKLGEDAAPLGDVGDAEAGGGL